MLKPQNGDRIVNMNYVTSLHPVYCYNGYYGFGSPYSFGDGLD